MSALSCILRLLTPPESMGQFEYSSLSASAGLADHCCKCCSATTTSYHPWHCCVAVRCARRALRCGEEISLCEIRDSKRSHLTCLSTQHRFRTCAVHGVWQRMPAVITKRGQCKQNMQVCVRFTRMFFFVCDQSVPRRVLQQHLQ